MPAIVLATLNARYAHASLGLRCLRANLGDLRDDSVILEFTIAGSGRRDRGGHPRAAAARGGVRRVHLERRADDGGDRKAPGARAGVVVVVGGPEVSHEIDQQRICALADFVVTGWGDVTFARLAQQILRGPRPLMKVHAGAQPPLETLVPAV